MDILISTFLLILGLMIGRMAERYYKFQNEKARFKKKLFSIFIPSVIIKNDGTPSLSKFPVSVIEFTEIVENFNTNIVFAGGKSVINNRDWIPLARFFNPMPSIDYEKIKEDFKIKAKNIENKVDKIKPDWKYILVFWR